MGQQPADSTSGKLGRLAHLDSLRFFAAFLVLVQHVFERRPGIVGDYFVPLGPGVAGVAIFFFISGYVIPLAARDGFAIGPFIVRRVFRIYPLFLAAVATLALGGATGVLKQWSYMPSAPLGVWLGNILLVQDFVGIRAFLGVSWTLAVELIWYLIFALAVALAGKRAADVLDIIVPASLVTLAMASLALGTRIPLGRPTMIYAAVIGFQCYRYAAAEIGERRLWRSILVFSAVALATNYVAFGVYTHSKITLAQALGPWTIGTIIFLAGVLWRPVRETAFFTTGLLPQLGAMSYSTYLLHPIAIAVAVQYVTPSAHVPVILAATLALSVMGYRLVERPGIELGRRVIATQGSKPFFGAAQ